MFEQIISILAPHHCLSCNKEGLLLCYECQNKIPTPKLCYRCKSETAYGNACQVCLSNTYFTQLYTRTEYKGVQKQLVHTYKFKRAKAAHLSIALALQKIKLPSDIDWVTHLPTATSRVRMRGYDQAQLVARRYARDNALPYASLLARDGQQRQLGQKAQQRSVQLQGSFHVRYKQLVQNRTILLFDDVITTGASVNEAAKVLKTAGAAKIYGLVFAMA